MNLIFESSVAGRGCCILPPLDVPKTEFPKNLSRASAPRLPELSETDISRHYTKLVNRTYGVNNGFYPLGSCTMKYNPRINEQAAGLPGFTNIHPLQPEHSVQGALEVMALAEQYLCEITGMDEMTFQPAAGAHGELTGVLLIKQYHKMRGDTKRTKIIVPDSAHGTNPATAVMAGYTCVNIPSDSEGGIDLAKLREVVGEDTAGLMLTNPNTLGIFDKNILEITKIVRDAGGLSYYDGANLNPIMGIVRPGDMGFDVVHLNLHKTFSTPHGGGGPGSGAVGCKTLLAEFLPKPHTIKTEKGFTNNYNLPNSIGRVKAYYGNFLVVVRALTYILTLGREGIPEAAKMSVLNANYMKQALESTFDIATKGHCMHEFIITMEKMHKEKGVTATDVAKGLLDAGIHPPTMYFPLIVAEDLMIEPTETESKTTLDEAIEIFKKVYKLVDEDPALARTFPLKTPIRRPDEVRAARETVLKYHF